MNVKRYFAPTAREALRALKEALGPDAIVLSNRAVEGGVEILALQQLSRRVDIQFAVAEADYAKAVSALHRRLVEQDGERTATFRSAA